MTAVHSLGIAVLSRFDGWVAIREKVETLVTVCTQPADTTGDRVHESTVE
jgi:hypothetical protein